MCNHQAMKKKRRMQTATTTPTFVSLKSSCKTSTRRRKPKYLSLNLKIGLEKKPDISRKKMKLTKELHQQLTLFPLYPENLVEDTKDYSHEQENEDNDVVASFLFDAATDSSSTLNGLLTSTTSDRESPAVSPLSLTFAYGEDRCDDHNYGLVRTAIRGKERDPGEEKWVSYSEVVENNRIIVKEEEVMSSSCIDDHDDVDEGAWSMKHVQGQNKKLLLSLKLDYQEILNAWSDRGPLYVDGESPQTVPELHDANVAIYPCSNVGNLWSVPEMTSNDGSDAVGGKGGWKMEHREASVLRYKEKRQNRLFSKRIRYEVRKLNAEKRPRMKGRFVKRSSEV
ncbi:zinc finger protein CONSTANS-LIKE 6-like isoform X1 [Mangifera indica]|uniref:zinc finger protein CONSTANS-LIKE 6-like isoform X1 n=1 Tax=Mangifera indica TaxID=29780 RepID=UPI001CFBABCF|nr:zinc finger protein CONSTANS-LIKE 6-like isoform X1 [Mangifera indica]